MATFTVNRKQSLVDVCLQLYGSTQFLFKLAKDNGLFIDSDLTRGSILTYDPLLGNPDVKLVTESQGLKMVNPEVDLTSDLVVLDFAGDDYVTFNEATVPSSAIIKFKLWLDKDSGFVNQQDPLFHLGDTSDLSRSIIAGLQGSTITFTSRIFLSTWYTVDITGLSNQILSFEVEKTGNNITDVKINGVTVNNLLTKNPQSSASGFNYVGGQALLSDMLDSCAIWDIEIQDNLGTTLHSWPGTGPNANTDAAWVDSVGGINGTVFGSPETRIIS